MMNVSRLKDIREDKDINQETMAKILGVNRSTYSLWELGINIIPLSALCNYAKYFNHSVDYVLGLTNNRNDKNNINKLDLKVLGNNLKSIRNENNLSQEKIASILDVTQACITRYEKGIICISTSNLYKFAKKFNVSMNNLLIKKEKN